MAANGDRLLVLDGDRIAIRHRATTYVVARDEVTCARAAKNGTWIVSERKSAVNSTSRHAFTIASFITSVFNF